MAASTSDQITAFATVVLGIFTIVIAAVAINQAKLTRAALAAAERDTIEATRSRIDQRAPSVTVTADRPAGFASDWMNAINNEDLFDLETNRNDTFASVGWFQLSNEGRSTGLVTVPPGTLLFDPVTNGVTSMGALRNYQPTKGWHEFPLRPGESRLLAIEVRKTLAEWVSEETRRVQTVEISVRDTFTVGVSDLTYACIVGIPVLPAATGFAGNSEMPSVYIETTERRYNSERELGGD